VTNSSALASATGLSASPPRYHHSQPQNANETSTQISDQRPASFMLTRCAPCCFIAKKSISRAITTKLAKIVQRSGVPMFIEPCAQWRVERKSRLRARASASDDTRSRADGQ